MKSRLPAPGAFSKHLVDSDAILANSVSPSAILQKPNYLSLNVSNVAELSLCNSVHLDSESNNSRLSPLDSSRTSINCASSKRNKVSERLVTKQQLLCKLKIRQLKVWLCCVLNCLVSILFIE